MAERSYHEQTLVCRLSLVKGQPARMAARSEAKSLFAGAGCMSASFWLEAWSAVLPVSDDATLRRL